MGFNQTFGFQPEAPQLVCFFFTFVSLAETEAQLTLASGTEAGVQVARVTQPGVLSSALLTSRQTLATSWPLELWVHVSQLSSQAGRESLFLASSLAQVTLIGPAGHCHCLSLKWPLGQVTNQNHVGGGGSGRLLKTKGGDVAQKRGNACQTDRALGTHHWLLPESLGHCSE